VAAAAGEEDCPASPGTVSRIDAGAVAVFRVGGISLTRRRDRWPRELTLQTGKTDMCSMLEEILRSEPRYCEGLVPGLLSLYPESNTHTFIKYPEGKSIARTTSNVIAILIPDFFCIFDEKNQESEVDEYLNERHDRSGEMSGEKGRNSRRGKKS
jgi:hypothetical protein